jgi:hypothetical protein
MSADQGSCGESLEGGRWVRFVSEPVAKMQHLLTVNMTSNRIPVVHEAASAEKNV